MSEKPPIRFPTEGMAEAYEKLLLLSMKEAKLVKEKTGPALHRIIDSASEKLSELEELTKEQSEKLAEYLKRDLTEAANFMADTSSDNPRDFKEWLAIDTELIEDFLLDHMMQAADQTTVELARLKNAAENAEYHTGEITGPGVLICDHCGESLHFNKAGHIPPCSRCHETQFHRLKCNE